MIEKFREYTHEKACVIKSKRLFDEMKVFIWKNGKAQAQEGYNDDAVMSFSMGLYLRDTALRFRKSNVEYDRTNLMNMTMDRGTMNAINAHGQQMANPWAIQADHGKEDITWLLR